MTTKVTLATLAERIETLELNTPCMETVASLELTVARLTQQLENAVHVILRMQAGSLGGRIETPENTVIAEAKSTSPDPKTKRNTPVRDTVSKDDDFLTIVAPYMGRRVTHNVANDVECDTEQLTAIGSTYGVTDYRFNLTRKERSIFKASFKSANLTLKDAITALAGAVERTSK